jgi:hypothetical protein
MASQNEVRESHEQFSAASSLDARAGGVGEVVDVEGIRVANARSPWYLMNAALLTGPVSSPAELAARASAASAYFGREHRFAGSRQWLGAGDPETLSRLGLTKAFTVVQAAGPPRVHRLGTPSGQQSPGVRAGHAAQAAATASSWPSPGKAGASARPVRAAAWPRRRRTSPTA